MMGQLSAIKAQVMGACDKRDPLYADINSTAFQAAMENARRELVATAPHAICPYCKAGPGMATCKPCHQRGYVGKFTWANAPGDLRARARTWVLKQKNART